MNSNSLYEFFVNKDGSILDLDDLLSYDTSATYPLKGKVVYIGNGINFVIQGFSQENPSLSNDQLALFRKTCKVMLDKLKIKYPNLSQVEIEEAKFVNSLGKSVM